MRKPWWQHEGVIAGVLILFFPLGLFLMWRYASWGGRWKWVVTGIASAFVALMALGMAIPDEDPLAGLTPEQVVSVHATATQEALAAQEEEARQEETAAREEQERAYLEALAEQEEPTNTSTKHEECEEAGGTWHNHYFSFRDAECHPATPTPEPTEAREPTETPKPTALQGPPEFTTAECAYLESLTGQSEDLGAALARFWQLFSTPQLFSDEWRLSVALQLVVIQVAYAEASVLHPPASLQAVHAAYMDGVSKFNDVTFLISKGIDNLDPDEILEAADLMLEGTEDIERTMELILEFGETRSGSC